MLGLLFRYNGWRMRENERLGRYDDFIMPDRAAAAVVKAPSRQVRGRDRGRIGAISIVSVGLVASIALSYAICSGMLMHIWNA